MSKIPRNERGCVHCAGLQDRYATCVHSRLDPRLKEAPMEKKVVTMPWHIRNKMRKKEKTENTTKCAFGSKHGRRR